MSLAGAISAARASNERSRLAANKKPEMTQLQKRKLQTRVSTKPSRKRECWK